MAWPAQRHCSSRQSSSPRRCAGIHTGAPDGGALYIIGSIVAGPLGAYIQYLDEATGDPRSYTVAASIQASIWVASSLLALLFVRKRQTYLHRQWMTRSVVVGPGVFLMSRFVDGVTGLGPVPDFDLAITFGCIALAVPVADVITNWSEMWRARGRSAKAQTS